LIVFLLCMLGVECSGYDTQIAQNALFLSYSAYCGNNVNSDWSCFWCKQLPQFNFTGTFGHSRTALFGFVGFNKNQIYVTFRGPSNVAGWIANADFNLMPYYNTGALVHRGFFCGLHPPHNRNSKFGSANDSIVSFMQFNNCDRSLSWRRIGYSWGIGIAEPFRINCTLQFWVSSPWWFYFLLCCDVASQGFNFPVYEYERFGPTRSNVFLGLSPHCRGNMVWW